MRIGLSVFMVAMVCSSCSRSEVGGTRSPQSEAVQDAVNQWRGEFDPAWRYSHARCISEAWLVDEVKRRVAQVLHKSRASACARLRAVSETTEMSINGDVAIVTVHAPNARAADVLRFSL